MTGYSLVDPSIIELKPSGGSGTPHIDLTEELNTTEMRSRLWYLDPGDALNFHRQIQQEELYFVVSGPGRMRIEEEYLTIPEGACVRVSPETRRQVFNDGDEERHIWLVVGAPPTENDGRPLPDDGGTNTNGL